MDNYWVKLFSALLTPLLAIITAYIAWQQWRTNNLKVRHELYERRLAVYWSVMEFLGNIFREAKVTESELLTFLQKTRESYFLLGPELSKYLDEIYNRAVDLRASDTKLHHPASNLPAGQERSRVAEENAELLKWFGDQALIVRERFAKYMKLS